MRYDLYLPNMCYEFEISMNLEYMMYIGLIPLIFIGTSGASMLTHELPRLIHALI